MEDDTDKTPNELPGSDDHVNPPSDPPGDPTADPKMGKRKALEALGCLLYIIAFLIMGGVLIAKLGKM